MAISITKPSVGTTTGWGDVLNTALDTIVAGVNAQAGALVPTAVKTANYTAAVSDLIPVDTTAGPVTITLPTAPADKAQVAVKHVIQGSANAVTIARGGTDVFNKAGGSTSLTLTTANQAMTLQYKASGGIWYVLSDSLSLTALNGTFVQQASAALGPVRFPPQPRRTMVSAFQSGHGWATAGTGWTWTTDTTDYQLGSQSMKGVGSGNIANPGKIQKSGLAPVNLTGCVVSVLVKYADVGSLNTLYVNLGNGGFAQTRLLAVGSGSGTGIGGLYWNDTYVWLTCDVANYQSQSASFDPTAVTDWQISTYDAVGTGAVTTHIQAIAYHTKPTAFPNGVVSFTFDDTLLSQYTLAAQAFDKYGDGASAFVIVDQLGIPAGQDPSGGRFSVDQAHLLEQYHNWEIGGHALTTANHDAGFPSLSTTQLQQELYGLKAWLRSEGFKGADWFAWPKGLDDPTSAKSVAKYFSWARHTNGTYSPLYPNMPRRAQAVALTSDTSVATFQSYIDAAKAQGKWLILMGHQVVTSGAAGSTNVNLADLQSIVDYCHTQAVPVRTVGDVLTSVT